jgi:methyl-accepting chemotaxis protein
MLKNMKIGARLILVGTLIIASPLIFVAIVAVRKAGTGLEQLSDQQLLARAKEIARNIDDIYGEEMKIATGFANNPAIVAAAAARDLSAGAGASDTARVVHGPTTNGSSDTAAIASAHLVPYGSVQGLAGAYESLNIVDTKGVVFVSSSPTAVGVDVTTRDYFKKAVAGQPNIGTVVLSKVTQKPITPIAVPVSVDGKVVGVFTMMLHIDFLNNLIINEKIGKTGYAFVLDSMGLTIAHPNMDNVTKVNVTQVPGMEGVAREMTGGKAGIMLYSYQGVPKAAAYAPIQSTGWSVALTLPISEYMAVADDMRNNIIVISLITLLVAFVVNLLFSRSVTVPLSKGVAFAQTVASGDFSRQLDIRQRDEIGDLANSLNGMSAKLAAMVATVQQNAQQLTTSSEQIANSAQKLSEGAQSQASSLEETSASVEELTSSVEQVAEHAQSQAAAAEQGTASMTQAFSTIEVVSKSLGEIAALSSKSVDNAVAGAKAVLSVVEGINTIARSSEQIGGIVDVISDIADQTNLLALNASIEAARAGEHGRGFAVVADEVSKLADRSSSSTKEIGSLIKESIKNVTSGVEIAKSSEQAMEQIRDASQLVNGMIAKVSESMAMQVAAIKELAKALENVSEMSQSISASTEEQTTNAKQVSQAVEGINEITQASASGAEEMSAATEQLSGMAQELQRMVSQFKIRDGNGKEQSEQASVGGGGARKLVKVSS